MHCVRQHVLRASAGPCSCVHGLLGHRRVTKRSTARASGVFQGIDLFSNDEDEDDVPSLEDALLSGRSITGHYLKEIYTTDADPIPYSGSVTVKRFKGKGRALVATSTLAAGELLLVNEPLVVVQGQGASNPQLSDLLRHLQQSKFSAAQQAVFSLLYTGEGKRKALPAPELAALCPWNYEPSNAPLAPLSLPPEDILGIVQHNAFGDAHADLLVSVLRGDTPRSHIGIWPEASMINHSCAPNAVHFSIAGKLLVRAVREVAPGEEITLNYLGRSALLPLVDRQDELQSTYGFSCGCPRCRLEADKMEEFGALLSGISSSLEELQPAVMDALAAGSNEGIARLQSELASLAKQLEGARRAALVGQQDWGWLQSSVYDLYQLQALLQEKAQPKSVASLKSMARCVEVAAGSVPGSDLHALVACKFVKGVERAYRMTDPRVFAAQTSGFNAIKSRYGSLDAATLRLLVDQGAEVARQLDEMALQRAVQ